MTYDCIKILEKELKIQVEYLEPGPLLKSSN